ncbi:6-phosphogluconolactonase [Dechloromonas sp. A34]|uniref:6-phosphogluconolactonase n=1 Tax=Dechloromonas sp. A34 TaxID=447588 RepID=UPI00224927CA|nr:6-phosphogluconolactonase [Dechloromonas sp. A34]
MLPADTRLLADGEALAVEACRLIVDAAQEAIRARRIFRLVLAGGRTPGRAYQHLATARQEWAAWEIFWGDERCLPADHPARNSVLAYQAWLAHVPLPAAQVHVIPAELGAAPAAAAYAKTIADQLPFDLVVFGMGEDGHTASLFPGSADAPDPVIAVYGATKAPAERVSLNYQSLRACRRQLILVSGTGKSAALAAWRQGEKLPIALAATDNACLLVDTGTARAAGLASG